ncbi:MAG: MMPL family transporter [Microbacterium sp.]|uniref:MMPL family transporter n=1 Tax=Microbacterium sp. TaxID=51671 RepID=UPI0039E531AF
MSTLLFSLGRWSYRHPWRVLVAWILLLGIAGGGVAVFAQGTDNTFSIPGTESEAGLDQLGRSFPQASGTSAQFVIVAPDAQTVMEAAFRDEIEATIDRLDDLDGVLAVTDPYSELVSGLVSDDERAAIVRLQFEGQSSTIPAQTKTDLQTISTELQDALPSGSQVAIGGELFAMSVPSVSLTEAVGVLIALFVLIVTFRSLAIAWFPLASALIGVALAIALIFVATAFATVSSTTPLLAIMLGLAVGIDYALFIVARHQDQVRAGVDAEESVARATGTAGSAVVFAGVTVLIALIGLAFANIPFLTTMGIAAAVAVALAVLVALTLTPALLGFAKGRVVGWRRRGVSSEPQTKRTGFASRWVGLVTRHPVVATVAVVAGLGLAAVPATSLSLSLPNAGMQPRSSEARIAYDLVSERFGAGFNGPIIMTGTIVTSTDPVALMEDIGAEIEQLPGVKTVALATPNETADTGIVQLIPTTGPDDPRTAELVRELRAQHDRLLDEYGVDLVVTGFTAVQIDISDRLGGALLPFALFVVGLSLILLAVVFRSIWVPVLAAAGYLLSVGAAFGIVSAVFIHGFAADLLHVTKIGPIISFMPIILMGVLFGLAMDYQVFLVSRMREDYVHARDRGRATAVAAVRSGYTASARVVTAAAIIMFAVFAAFVPEGDASLKPIALGLAAGIAIDAFLVRMTLVPAVMALLGEKAWFLPRVLGRMLPKVDIEGEAVERELTLRDWPADAAAYALAGDGVAVRADGGRTGAIVLFEDAAFRVRRGGTLLVQGDARATRAFLLAVSGRLAPSAGRLRVGGHLLPGRGHWVRAHVGVALLDGVSDPAAEVRRALARGTRIVAIDGLDGLDGLDRDRVAEALRDAASARDPLTVVASTHGPARALLADAHRNDADALTLSSRIPNVGESRRSRSIPAEFSDIDDILRPSAPELRTEHTTEVTV